MIAPAVEAIHPLLQEKGQTLEMDVPEAIPVLGDPRWLEQAVIDLLANAHRHTPSGTRVTVSGRAGDEGVALVVRDTGPGIAAADLDGVFARFRRAGLRPGGSGLGLAIVREIVELHGGRVWAESAQGHGASFHIALPPPTPPEEAE